MSTGCIVEAHGVCKSYARPRPGEPAGTVLKDVSLRVAAGEFVAITGSSGSGKSTLLNLLGALDRPSSGHISVLGSELETLSSNARATLRNRKLGFVFQNYNLLPRVTVCDNVALPLIYAGVGKPERRARSQAVLAHVGLAGYEMHPARELSGGQQQRVGLARALVHQPDLLLADEPTGNLDSATGRDILALLQALNASGLTIILVTHDTTCARAAGRVLRMSDGQLFGGMHA